VSIPDIGDVGLLPLTPGIVEQINSSCETDFQRSEETIARCVVDASGQRIFNERSEVAELPMEIYSLLSEAVSKINKLTKPEGAAKN